MTEASFLPGESSSIKRTGIIQMFTTIALIVGAFVVPTYIAVSVVGLINRRYERFLNPLTQSLRRPPGAQLNRELNGEQLQAGFGFGEILLPGLILVVLYTQYLKQPEQLSDVFIVLGVVVWLGWSAHSIVKFCRRVKRIKNLRLGYECELAVGLELDLLMMQGFRVFHDVPAGTFNVDHLIVGPPGVFAVETKGRSKTFSRDGKKEKQFRVSYSNGVLEFPNGRDGDAVPQAARQAKWVTNWLSEATGQQVAVRPVVVLPGWYIEIKDKPEVPVIASGYIQRYFVNQRAQVLTEADIGRIAYQVDQKVRDLPPGDVVRPLAVAG